MPACLISAPNNEQSVMMTSLILEDIVLYMEIKVTYHRGDPDLLLIL